MTERNVKFSSKLQTVPHHLGRFMFLQLGPMENVLVSISKARGVHCIHQQCCGTLKVLAGAWMLVLHQPKLQVMELGV